MSDDETNEGNDKGKETDNSTEDDKKPLSPVKEARSILEEIKKEKEELKEENNRREEMIAKEMVGGHSDAGQTQEKPKRLTDEEYADKFMKGEADPLTDDGISID